MFLDGHADDDDDSLGGDAVEDTVELSRRLLELIQQNMPEATEDDTLEAEVRKIQAELSMRRKCS